MGRESKVPVSVGAVSSPSHAPSVFHPGGLVPISTECVDRFAAFVYLWGIAWSSFYKLNTIIQG